MNRQEIVVQHRARDTASNTGRFGKTPPFLSAISRLPLAFIGSCARLLSHAQADKLGALMGRVISLAFPSRRNLARTNVRLAFPHETEDKIDRIIAGCYANLGKSLIEFLRLPILAKRGTIGEIISLEGAEHLDAALAKGRGVLLLTAHYGNWELVGARLVASGYKLNVLARHQKDKGTTRFVNELRESAGMEVLPARKGDVKRILGCLRQNEIIGFLNDQNAGRKGLFVDFFGRPASTGSGLALFALRSRAPVVPVFGIRNADGTHTARLFPELEIVKTGDFHRDIALNTALFSRVVETQIRTRPDLWFWLHDRWRTKPLK